MYARTDRSIITTCFDAICVDLKHNIPVTVPVTICGFYKHQDDIIETVTQRSILHPQLRIHRIINLRYVAEFRSMSDDFFKRHATIKDYYFKGE